MLQMDLDEEDKTRFWEVLDKVVRDVPSPEKIFIIGDFNRHIESLPRGYDDVQGDLVLGIGMMNDLLF